MSWRFFCSNIFFLYCWDFVWWSSVTVTFSRNVYLLPLLHFFPLSFTSFSSLTQSPQLLIMCIWTYVDTLYHCPRSFRSLGFLVSCGPGFHRVFRCSLLISILIRSWELKPRHDWLCMALWSGVVIFPFFSFQCSPGDQKNMVKILTRSAYDWIAPVVLSNSPPCFPTYYKECITKFPRLELWLLCVSALHSSVLHSAVLHISW